MISDTNNYQLKYSLFKHLFNESDIRGKDASGMAGIGEDNHVFSFKRPIEANKFIKLRAFKELLTIKPHTIIGHTRQATNGKPEKNKNNHPFQLKHLYLVHNGIITNADKLQDKYKFDLQSYCDSEILLHIIASHKNIIEGIRAIYKEVYGSFSVALLNTKNQAVYIFRNSSNPLHIAWSEKYKIFLFASTRFIIDLACDKTWYRNCIEDIFETKEHTSYSILKAHFTKDGVKRKYIKIGVQEKDRYDITPVDETLTRHYWQYNTYTGSYEKRQLLTDNTPTQKKLKPYIITSKDGKEYLYHPRRKRLWTLN